MGMYLMRQIGDRRVYGNPELPDFMVFLDWQELPWYWLGFDNFFFAMAMVLLVPGILAFIFGWFAFRSRGTGVYLSIITQAMTFALMLAFFRNDMGFGGNNGLTDFRELLSFDLRSQGTRAGLFIASGITLQGGFVMCLGYGHLKAGQGPGGHSRCGKPYTVLGLSGGTLQTVCLHDFGHDSGRRRYPVRPPGGHHQPR